MRSTPVVNSTKKFYSKFARVARIFHCSKKNTNFFNKNTLAHKKRNNLKV